MISDEELNAIEARLGIDDDAELTLVWTYQTIIRDTEALLAEVHRLRAALSPQVHCGHPAVCIASDDEGTSHCRWCEELAAA